MRAGRPGQLLAQAGLAAGLIALTLVPADDLLRWLGWSTCLACGDLETLDSVHNVLLFLPVGAVLSRLLGGGGRAVLAAAAASLAVELVQVVLPSRDPSWVDLLMNTTGAAGGALAYRLWRERGNWTTAEFAVAWAGAALLWLGATAASGVVLQPAAVPPEDLFGQWAPRRANFGEFRGRVVSFAAGSAEMPHGPVPDPGAVRAALQDGGPVRLVIVRDPPTGDRPVLLARVVARNHEVVAFTERRESFLARVRLRASDHGLRSPFIAVGDPAQLGGGVTIESLTRSDSVTLRVEAEGLPRIRRLPLEVGLGWATIAPVEVELGAWWWAVSSVWLGVLALPLGFCLGRTGGAASLLGAAVVLALVVTGLVGVPVVAGLATSHPTAWLGAIGGALTGRALGSQGRTSPRRIA